MARTWYDDRHAGADYVLTGPESLSQEQQVRIIGDVLGRDVEFFELTPDQFHGETEGIWPRQVVDMLLEAWAAAMGQPAYVTTTVADVLGVPARTYRQWLADHAAALLGDRPG